MKKTTMAIMSTVGIMATLILVLTLLSLSTVDISEIAINYNTVTTNYSDDTIY